MTDKPGCGRDLFRPIVIGVIRSSFTPPSKE
jgi:hypothetical protein